MVLTLSEHYVVTSSLLRGVSNSHPVLSSEHDRLDVAFIQPDESS